MTIDDIKEKCKEIDNEILTFLRVSKVFVFGSYALDQATEYSDIDFIVLTDNKNSNTIETTALLKKNLKSILAIKLI